jgi:hypothetical protein
MSLYIIAMCSISLIYRHHMLFKFLEKKINNCQVFLQFSMYIKTNKHILFLILLNEHNCHIPKIRKIEHIYRYKTRSYIKTDKS